MPCNYEFQSLLKIPLAQEAVYSIKSFVEFPTTHAQNLNYFHCIPCYLLYLLRHFLAQLCVGSVYFTVHCLLKVKSRLCHVEVSPLVENLHVDDFIVIISDINLSAKSHYFGLQIS